MHLKERISWSSVPLELIWPTNTQQLGKEITVSKQQMIAHYWFEGRLMTNYEFGTKQIRFIDFF